MIEAPAHARRIEKIPALLLCLLQDAGKLPAVPRTPRADVLGYRTPGLPEMMDLEWVAEWDNRGRVDAQGFRPVNGIIGFRDGYDFHSASDVREICYLAGSRRAVVDLVGWIRASGHTESRRVIGSFDCDNTALAGVIEAMGGVRTRCVFEDGAVCQA